MWIYADYKADESYTPSRLNLLFTFHVNFVSVFKSVQNIFYYRISIRAGTHFSDLQEVEVIDLNEPTGWIVIPLKDAQEKLV